MIALLVQHEVRDFKEWKKAFDANHKLRVDNGELSAQVFHTQKNPQDVIVLCQWSSLEKAEKFAASEELKTAMKNAGVVGNPNIQFLNKV